MHALRSPLLAIMLALLTASAPGYPGTEEVLAELNRLRTDPAGYAASLQSYRRLFGTPDSRTYTLPGEALTRRSIDGAPAVNEAIAALNRQAPVAQLAPGSILETAARTLADEQAETGAIGHRTARGFSPGERVKAQGGDIYVVEAVSYGFDSAEAIVRQLVIDDGIPGRGHRRTLLSPELRFAGIWCGPHARFGAMCVIDLSAWPAGKPRPE
ncbi:CAP domain-containing protein [Sphingomonas sp. GB1N7]|uniref:CAP domain-containing protein n=1 Tax=Parasphingomonas caseinilytica TaxID=3096158 RepID=UPI002FC8ED9F